MLKGGAQSQLICTARCAHRAWYAGHYRLYDGMIVEPLGGSIPKALRCSLCAGQTTRLIPTVPLSVFRIACCFFTRFELYFITWFRPMPVCQNATSQNLCNKIAHSLLLE